MRVPDNRKSLASRSGDKCAIPNCRRRLTQDSKSGNHIFIGEVAHIEGIHGGKGTKKQSARLNPDMTDGEYNNFNNLIYLCPTCHKVIDSPQGEKDYPVSRLHQIKKEHEKLVLQERDKASPNVQFEELEMVTKWVSRIQPSDVTSDYALLKVEDKIRKNDLDDHDKDIIKMGLLRARDVKVFIEVVAQIDPDFPERLKAGFLSEYWRKKQYGAKGSELFGAMCHFAQQEYQQQELRLAGLVVLVYLFEACEVFEK